MSIETFDDFTSTETIGSDVSNKPFQFRDEKNEKGTLQWLTTEIDYLEQASQSRMETYRRYQSLYKGIHWRNLESRRSDDYETTNQSNKKPKYTVNFVMEMVDGLVSKMETITPGVAVLPNNDEQSDINNAKACKMLLTSRADQLDLQEIHNEAEQIKRTFGSVFQKVCWNPDIGDIHPKFKRAEARAKQMGKEFKDEAFRIGDVDVENYGPDRVFLEKGKEKFKDVDYMFTIEWVPLEELKSKYKKKALDIKENNRLYYNYEVGTISKPSDFVQVVTFYHKKTNYLKDGAMIKFTDDVILEDKALPYDHGQLPFVYDVDIKVYREIWGRSFISQIESMQRFYNNLQSGIGRDLGVGSAPKWMAPKGSVSAKELNNDFNVVFFKGMKRPELVSHNPVSEQALKVQDRLEEKISKLSRLYDISRGNVPSGVTANSALRFLDEQETQMLATGQKRRKQRILSVYKMMVQVMAQYYDESDGRITNILGRYNDYMVRTFKEANFTQVYDVRLQNSPMLPDTKGGKISAIIDLNTSTQTDPIFRREQVVEMLDLATDETFRDQATVALNAARTVLEIILDGQEPPAPRPSDDFLVYYSVFSRALQEATYRVKAGDEIISRMETYVLAMEMLMFERAKKNIKFLQELMNLNNYPMFFELPAPLSALMPVPPAPAGASGGVDTSKIENLSSNNSEG